MSRDQKITRDDIKAKLAEIQDDATHTVEDAKSQIIAGAAIAAIVLLLLAYLVGRRGGRKRSTIIELKRN
jgi:hypothetical protein